MVLVMVALTVGLTACGGDDTETVAVKGGEFTFIDVPQRIKSGVVELTFENIGTEKHEMSVIQLNAGETMDTALAEPQLAYKRATSRANFFAQPGKFAPSPVKLDLPPGNYIMTCFIIGADRTPHYFKGMKATFEVA